MQTKSSPASAQISSPSTHSTQPPTPSSRLTTPDQTPIHLELTLKLHNYPTCDREPVKVLVIGSKEAVTSIVHALHRLRFAEVFEWTDFLAAPGPDAPLQFRVGEMMKALVKYVSKE